MRSGGKGAREEREEKVGDAGGEDGGREKPLILLNKHVLLDKPKFYTNMYDYTSVYYQANIGY